MTCQDPSCNKILSREEVNYCKSYAYFFSDKLYCRNCQSKHKLVIDNKNQK